MKKCIVCGTELEDQVKFCPECGTAQPEAQPVVEETVTIEEPVQWYYVVNGATQGPVAEADMLNMIQNGAVTGTTYVWKAGMDDWKMLSDTPLAAYIPVAEPKTSSSASYTGGYAGSTQPAGSYHGGVIAPRSIAMNLLLSIVTCGIWTYVWIYMQAKDTNEVLASRNLRTLESPMMVVLFTLLTCGLYGIFYYWKAGKALSQVEVNGQYITNSSAFLGIMFFFMSVITICCYQDILNDIARGQ